MKINLKMLLFFLLSVFLVFYITYEKPKNNSFSLHPKAIDSLDTGLFSTYIDTLDTNRDIGLCWGYKKKAIVKDAHSSVVASVTKVTKTKGKNRLCIEGSCYNLVGIHSKKNTPYVTLYNQKTKSKLKDFKEDSSLEKGIIVSKIEPLEVIFKDTDTKREWRFRIFDINATKYKPKEPKK